MQVIMMKDRLHLWFWTIGKCRLNTRASWRGSLGGGGVRYISIEGHYLHKKWNFAG